MSEGDDRANLLGGVGPDTLAAVAAFQEAVQELSATAPVRPRQPVEYRSAETLDVKFAERTVTVLAMPYELPTDLVMVEGRQIREVVSRGAFGKVQHRKDVRAYRGHNRDAVVGRAIALNPDHEAGLLAELRMSRTPGGDEMLELAADQLIDLSVGFAPIEQRWSADRSERRIDRAYLDHIAFVGDPAYPTQVLAVRAAVEPELSSPVSNTPRKDQVRLELLQMGYRPPE